MNFWNSLSGMTKVRITTADSADLMAVLLKENIELFDIHDENDLSVSLKIRRRDVKRLKSITEKRQDVLKIVENFGTYWSLKRILLRPAVIFGLLIVFLSAVCLPSRVFFVQVQGNESVPTNLIVEYAGQCGIGFGASRSAVRSEKVKNSLLEKIPQIQWIGINTQGCTAVISVREKSEQTQENADQRVRSIVAACDGVIDQCTVTKGNPLCKPGSAVKAGEVLVSGYTDCGITIQAVRAEAEIFAKTRRTVEVVTPMECTLRGQKKEEKKKYSLIIGKKLINFYKGSGISDTECVKMKEIKYLSLPGGFQLPIALVTERQISYETEPSAREDLSWVEGFADNYLRSIMISGRILESSVVTTCSTDTYRHLGTYDCYEMIGIPKYEEITG